MKEEHKLSPVPSNFTKLVTSNFHQVNYKRKCGDLLGYFSKIFSNWEGKVLVFTMLSENLFEILHHCSNVFISIINSDFPDYIKPNKFWTINILSSNSVGISQVQSYVCLCVTQVTRGACLITKVEVTVDTIVEKNYLIPVIYIAVEALSIHRSAQEFVDPLLSARFHYTLHIAPTN